MGQNRLYLVTDVPGFTPNISRLVSMMNYARYTTLRAVRDLNTAQLDHRPHGFNNTIGVLLEHLAAVEIYYQAFTFEGRMEPTPAELARWGAGLDLGEHATEIRGHSLEHYVAQLEQVRAVTLTEFGKRDDDWLHREFPFWDGDPSNNYFCWFHVFEDEINHRGQIRLIRKNLPPELAS
jgi:uncharacterized damage-inducible protein DinB